MQTTCIEVFCVFGVRFEFVCVCVRHKFWLRDTFSRNWVSIYGIKPLCTTVKILSFGPSAKNGDFELLWSICLLKLVCRVERTTLRCVNFGLSSSFLILEEKKRNKNNSHQIRPLDRSVEEVDFVH